MDAFLHSVDAFIRRHDLLRSGEALVVGVSGGVDSIVVTDVLRRRSHSLTAVHVNFRLRGDASDADEAFVRDWCGERGIELVVRSFDTKRRAEERGESVQEAARNLRYDAFERVASEAGCSKIALGHHRDDQAETLLLNLFRGTGPEGLAGMPIRRPVKQGSEIEVVRPLLGSRRAAIEAYARKAGLEWRDDRTNTAPRYLRGALRGDVIPLLEKHFGPAVTENVARSADLMRAYIDASLDARLEAVFSAALREDDGRGVVDLDRLEGMPTVLRHRVFIEAVRRWLPNVEANADMAAEIDRLTSSQVGRRLEYGSGVVWRERARLLFSPEGMAGPANPVQLREGASIDVSYGTVRAQRLRCPPECVKRAAPYDVYLDARSIRFPLSVRPWRPGDRFSPFGMQGSKKVSDFLTDEQVPPNRKAEVAVVESDGRIIWVVPFRISREVRLRDDSVETIHLSFEPRNDARERSV